MILLIRFLTFLVQRLTALYPVSHNVEKKNVLKKYTVGYLLVVFFDLSIIRFP